MLSALCDGLEKSMATCCSGCDIAVKLMELLQQHWQDTSGINLSFCMAFACERDEDKRAFINEQHGNRFPDFFNCAHLFREMADSTIGTVFVPWSWLLVAGYSCTSISSSNTARKRYKACIQSGIACETSDTFWQIWDYIKAHLPHAVVLENVKNLTLKIPASDISGADYIVGLFEQLKYWCMYVLG